VAISKRMVLVSLFALFCTGCSLAQGDTPISKTAQSLINAPLPLPEFITRIAPPPGSTIAASDKICISVYQGALWDVGTDAATLESYIVSNTRFTIDDQPVTPEGAYTLKAFGLTKDGQITDKYGSDIEFCLAPKLTPTAHVIVVTTSSISGKQFVYSWAITVK
jgi:hypothetical protein